MENEDPKCRWCKGVYLSDDGTCPNPAHPARCPFCGYPIEQMNCSRVNCVSNQPVSKKYSSLPPRTSLTFSDFTDGRMQEARTARVLSIVLRAPRAMDLDANDEEDETKPGLRAPQRTQLLVDPKACMSETDQGPPTTKKGASSGVYLSNCALRAGNINKKQSRK